MRDKDFQTDFKLTRQHSILSKISVFKADPRTRIICNAFGEPVYTLLLKELESLSEEISNNMYDNLLNQSFFEDKAIVNKLQILPTKMAKITAKK